jgi:catechol 2,3-dioxygenase-like lactoylglutathione lyase family enzyme
MSSDRVEGFDHVSLPMQHTDEMIDFYRSLGFDVVERKAVVSVYAGEQMINFHRPELWPNERFTLRAPAARPPCGDLCFRWSGSVASLRAALEGIGAEVEEGPVEREGGRRAPATSIYIRDADGNLLEFMVYDEIS